MNNLRKMMLPPGWYPERAESAAALIERWRGENPEAAHDAVSCIAPHAGWSFSGKLALSAIERLCSDVEVIVLIGGHLPAASTCMMSSAEKFETPFGDLEADKEFREGLSAIIEFQEDLAVDNTVEIQLPFVKYLFPHVKILYLRAPPADRAISLGTALFKIGQELGKRISVIGSTDLTHYGPAYGVTTAGLGDSAVTWVRDQNDKKVLEHLLSFELKKAISHAVSHGSACSIGAAAAAGAFAIEAGATKGNLVGYSLSCEKTKSDSFVGYGGIVFL